MAKQLIIRYSDEKQLHERVSTIARRENRSMTQQIVHYIEEGLKRDEISQEQEITIEEIKKEIIEKVFK